MSVGRRTDAGNDRPEAAGTSGPGQRPPQPHRDLIDAVWQDQVKLGIELQENLLQMLAGMKMLAGSLHTRLAADQSAQAKQAADLLATAEKAHNQMRELRRQLVPVEPDGVGLMVALGQLADQTRLLRGVHCEFSCRKPVQVDDNMLATQFFRIAEDAVELAVACRSARNIKISLSEKSDQLTLSVVDDGRDAKVSTGHVNQDLVVRIMQYRAQAVAARLDNKPTAQGGREVRCSLRR